VNRILRRRRHPKHIVFLGSLLPGEVVDRVGRSIEAERPAAPATRARRVYGDSSLKPAMRDRVFRLAGGVMDPLRIVAAIVLALDPADGTLWLSGHTDRGEDG
jgi:hypothetical protein